jgi:membrane protein insertase Oxa1/YidC/SpoIIIJ
MKWYHWVFIVALQLFINVLILVFMAKNIKVVSFMEITAMGVDELAKAIQAGEDPQKLQQMQMEKLRQVQEKLSRQNGIVLLKECVVKGPFEDITHEVLGK